MDNILFPQPNKFTPVGELFRTTIEVGEIGHIVKKNNRPIWQGRVGKSKQLILAEKNLMRSLIGSRHSLGWDKFPISKPMWCIFCFYFKDFYVKPKRKSDLPRMSLTLGDLSNLYQLPEDCLVDSGIISNDALIMSHDYSRKLPSQNGRDYLEIFIIDYPYEPTRPF